MNVCYFLGTLNRGGTEVLALDVCRNFYMFQDIDVYLLSRKRGNMDALFLQTSVPKQVITPRSMIDIIYFFRLRKYFKANRIDIVHAHQGIDAIYAFLASLGLPLKVISTHHGGFRKGRLYNMVLRMAIRCADKNLFVSNSCLDLYRNHLGIQTIPRSTILYNGIDLNRIKVTKHKSIRDELRLSKTDLVLGMVGNFYNNVRDQLTVCRSLVAVFDAFPHAHFIFVGGKSQKHPQHFDECYEFCVNHKILDKVHFLGLREDIPSILSELDVFVYSSNHDTFGISLVEAMLSGLPCVINSMETLMEISKEGQYGVVFKSKDADSLVSALLALLKDKTWQVSLGRQSKAYAMDNYSINSHIASLEKLYTSLC